MDTTENAPTVLSLCTGYGGIERGIERVIGELGILAHVEIEAYAIANLVAKMEAGQMASAPIWTNLKTFPTKPFRGQVDILTGGYPCQPFSHAGKKLGEDDPRHLWPFIRNIIDDIVPRLCFFENVEGHVNRGLRDVLLDLEDLGYSATFGIFSAIEIGAPHHRKRVFILAKRNGCRVSRGWGGSECGLELEGVLCSEGERNEIRSEVEGRSDSPGELANASSERLEGQGDGAIGAKTKFPMPPRESQYEWESKRVIEPEVGGTIDGLENRVDRLRLLGNGVVPQTAERAWKVLFRRALDNAESTI